MIHDLIEWLEDLYTNFLVSADFVQGIYKTMSMQQTTKIATKEA